MTTSPQYSDAGHRPHADHTGEFPQLKIDVGPQNLKVTLDAWGPSENPYAFIYNQLQSNWGEHPCDYTMDEDLSTQQMAYVESCIAGKTLPNVLEAISTVWTIDGVSRAATHQIVRTRIGASFMQHGGRDNDWRHRNFRMSETVARICEDLSQKKSAHLLHCITAWCPIEKLKEKYKSEFGLEGILKAYLMFGKEIYSALVDAGIPWQDARRFLHIGTETYIHANYNFLALKGVVGNRAEHIMDWEINCIAQLMIREVRIKMPDLFGKYLRSHSDASGKAMFSGLDSWPPDQKYPSPWKQSERKHRPEQMPFWVLTEKSLAGGEIEWIPTNGTYPDRERGEIV